LLLLLIIFNFTFNQRWRHAYKLGTAKEVIETPQAPRRVQSVEWVQSAEGTRTEEPQTPTKWGLGRGILLQAIRGPGERRTLPQWGLGWSLCR